MLKSSILVLRMILLAAITLASQTASAAKGPQVVAQLAGTYDGVHRDWKDTVILKADGTYARGSGDPGTWTFDGKTLALKWKNWGAEPVQFKGPGSFVAADNHFTLTLRNRADSSTIPGTYDGVHPDWKDTVTLAEDGTYKRGSGDPGVWIFDGKTLVLFWINWGAEPVDLKSPGKFSSSNGKFTLTRRGGAVAVAPPPAPAPAPQPKPGRSMGDSVLGQWAWKFEGDNSIWGPDVADFSADGTITFQRDKKGAGTWNREGGTVVVKLGTGEVTRFASVDNDHMKGVINGYNVLPERVGSTPPPAPAPVAAVAPPPPAPVTEGNSSRMIKTDKRTYKKGETVTVSYFGMPGESTDWTNVIAADQATDEWGDWSYNSGADGQRTVKNLKPGTYEARAYFNGTTSVEDKVTFTVTP